MLSDHERDLLERGAVTVGMTEDGRIGVWRDGPVWREEDSALGYGDTIGEAIYAAAVTQDAAAEDSLGFLLRAAAERAGKPGYRVTVEGGEDG